LVRQVWKILDDEVPYISTGWLAQWYMMQPYVKGWPGREHAGLYNITKWDTVWLDK
jgi:hypothetical protein